MSKKGLEWTPKQVEVAELLHSGTDPQAVVTKGFRKTMVSRVTNAIKAESKQCGNRNRNKGVDLENKIWLTTRSQNDELYRALAGLLIPNSSYHRWHQCLIEVHCSTLQAEAC